MKEKYQNWTFALFSAHLCHFFGNRSWMDHPSLYDLFIQFHKPKPWSTLFICADNKTPDLSGMSPSILCLYHVGAHFETILVLGNMGMSFDIIVDKDIYVRNKELFSSLQLRLQKGGRFYRFLFSDDPTVLLKVRSTLAEGRHVLVFADGNSGVSNVSKDQRIAIRFFNGHLKVRKGIAMISHILKTAIYPIFLRNNNDSYHLDILEPIVPDKHSNRDSYNLYCMQMLYNHLAEEICDQPLTWECWSYLHSNGSFDPPAISRNDQVIDSYDATCNMTSESWVKVSFQGDQVYFDRDSYSVIR